jgi:chemotaxis signal transduction protein
MTGQSATLSAPARASVKQDDQEELQLVVFPMQAEQYAPPVTSVREIIRYQPPPDPGDQPSDPGHQQSPRPRPSRL